MGWEWWFKGSVRAGFEGRHVIPDFKLQVLLYDGIDDDTTPNHEITFYALSEDPSSQE